MAWQDTLTQLFAKRSLLTAVVGTFLLTFAALMALTTDPISAQGSGPLVVMRLHAPEV
jgi:glycerol uptake facilitator-like aquaporin